LAPNTAGEAKKPVFLELDWILSQFGRRRAEAKKAYRRYVLKGLQGKSPWEKLKGSKIAWRLSRAYGIPLAEIARDLGVCTSAIAKAVRKIERGI
jgi:hypothetical protein